MKYAIISDIHGNLPALELVMKDAKENDVDSFIFVGDYFLSNPFPDECMTIIRSIENKCEMQTYFDNDDKFCSVISSMDSGVYIFGHSHIQWNWQSDDGKITLINPGSCGLPLDGIKNSIPYTILEISDNGHVTTEEKRLPFSMEDYINILRNSDQYEKANVWTKIIIKELDSGFEHLYFFLRYVEKYADKIGDTRRPFAVDTWEKAYELWEKEYCNERI